MRTYILLFALLVCPAGGLFSQYMYVEGKTFKLNGQDFYPVMLDYSFTVGYDSWPTNQQWPSTFYIAPYQHFGDDLSFECNGGSDCLNDIRADFDKIASMGFNTVRFTIGAEWDNTVGKFGMKSNLNDPQSGPSECFLTFDQPYINDPHVALYFGLIDQALGEAQAAGLKVMLDVAFFNTGHMNNAHLKFVEFLGTVGAHFQSNTNLLAYVIIEEVEMHDNQYYNTKEGVCDKSAEYYNAIKATDPNHLVSISGFDVTDVFEWDIGAMTIDFYQPHIYPLNLAYEGYDVMKARQRVEGRLYWLNNNCPMPWLIGETGFKACATVPGIDCITTEMNGTLTEQEDYANFSLERVRHCGGAGYGWWVFQDLYLAPLISGGNIRTDGYGLLYKGLTANNPDKPVVSAFEDYAPPAANLNFCTQPANYYDPFNCGLYNTNEYGALHGYVYDQNGAPIKDAVVVGFNWLEPSTSVPSEPVCDYMYTFTDANGYFKIIPYNHHSPGVPTDQKFVMLGISAIGAERMPSLGGWDNIGILPPGGNLGNITLQRNVNQYSNKVSGVTVTSNSYQDLNALGKLTVDNTTVQANATANIRARFEVNVKSTFRAEPGSLTHIYCGLVFPDCGMYSGYHAPQQETEEETTAVMPPPASGYSIQPNPNTGNFTIRYNGNPEQVTIEIYNAVGQLILTKKQNETESRIDISAFDDGIYFVKIIMPQKTSMEKIIKQ